MDYKDVLAQKIGNIVNIDINEIKEYIEIPPNSELGDYAFPCFKLAKELKKSPQLIASEIGEKINIGDDIEKLDVVGGYLNFYINKKNLVKNTLESINDTYGQSNIGEGKTVVIDYSAPNIAKPFHIGHLRSTVIGGALYKIYKVLGYNVVGINHLGDWGMGVSKTIAGYEMWKDEYDFSENPINSILKIYVRFNKLEKEEPEITE